MERNTALRSPTKTPTVDVTGKKHWREQETERQVPASPADRQLDTLELVLPECFS